jgi:hypothetical protein
MQPKTPKLLEDIPMARRHLQEAKNRLTVAARQAKPRESLVEFFRKSPLAGIALEVGRSRRTGRRVRL